LNVKVVYAAGAGEVQVTTSAAVMTSHKDYHFSVPLEDALLLCEAILAKRKDIEAALLAVYRFRLKEKTALREKLTEELTAVCAEVDKLSAKLSGKL
jgi:hypothetical protein